MILYMVKYLKHILSGMKNGRKWIECYYVDGKMNGYYQSWRKKGKKWEYIHYTNGIRSYI